MKTILLSMAVLGSMVAAETKSRVPQDKCGDPALRSALKENEAGILESVTKSLKIDLGPNGAEGLVLLMDSARCGRGLTGGRTAIGACAVTGYAGPYLIHVAVALGDRRVTSTILRIERKSEPGLKAIP